MRVKVRLFTAAAPLLLSAFFAWMVMESHLNLGGGEKDIFLALPLALWSLVYLFSALAFWWHGTSLGRSVLISSVLASVVVAIAWFFLFWASWFRVH